MDGKDWFYAARPVAGKALVLLRPRVIGAAAWRPYLEGLLIAAAIGVALAAAISLLLARRIARPVRRVAEASRRLAAGEAPDAVPAEGAAELASLAESFNHMAEQLEHARDAERAFLLSVSHELKTPLTAVLGYAEGLSDGTIDAQSAAVTISKEAARLDRLVRDILDLARMNRHEFSVRTEPVDLAEVADECYRRHRPQAEAYGISLSLDTVADATVRADADRVVQALSNLVENALRVLPAGGSVRIVARPGAPRRRGRRAGRRAGGSSTRVRALLPPLAVRGQPPGGYRAGPGDRRRARAGDGRLGGRPEQAGKDALLDPPAGRGFGRARREGLRGDGCPQLAIELEQSDSKGVPQPSGRRKVQAAGEGNAGHY